MRKPTPDVASHAADTTDETIALKAIMGSSAQQNINLVSINAIWIVIYANMQIVWRCISAISYRS